MILRDDEQAFVERLPASLGRFSAADDMRVERGTKRDWDALHALHYKAESLPAGSRFWRCVTAEGDLVGITVMSTVSLLLAPRHLVMPRLRPGGGGIDGDTKITNVQRGKWLNANMRRASRIVTDTLYRGTGVSYRMVNLAMRMEKFRFVEIQSSMSKFNPFDVKAGFKHAHLRHSNAYHKGLDLFRKYFEGHPADHQAIMAELNAMPLRLRERALADIRFFYYKNSAKEQTGGNLRAGNGRVEAMAESLLIKELQQLVFASPVYGIWENPDYKTDLPDVLPLRAFDLQSPDEPLRLDLL